METGSSSLGVPGASSGSNDSLHGLKFGKKIYFEDGGGGNPSKASPPAQATVPVQPAKKGKGVVQGGQQQPPRCRVEGCMVDLRGAKAYYCRHKVCGMHSKAPKVIVEGIEQRFCQQCSRFHQLSEFDQGKRSCRRRLQGHNERRRKPPQVPFTSHYGRLASSFHEEPVKFRSILMDFSYPRLSSTAGHVWPTVKSGDRVAGNQWQGFLDSPPSAAAVRSAHPYLQGPPGAAPYHAPELPPGECLAGVSDSSCALSLLSSQSYGNNSIRIRAPTYSASTGFDGSPMSHPAISNNFLANSWGVRGHGGRANSHVMHHEMGLGVTEACDAQFQGELDLALQGNEQCLGHCSGRPYDHSCHEMHWTL